MPPVHRLLHITLDTTGFPDFRVGLEDSHRGPISGCERALCPRLLRFLMVRLP